MWNACYVTILKRAKRTKSEHVKRACYTASVFKLLYYNHRLMWWNSNLLIHVPICIPILFAPVIMIKSPVNVIKFQYWKNSNSVKQCPGQGFSSNLRARMKFTRVNDQRESFDFLPEVTCISFLKYPSRISRLHMTLNSLTFKLKRKKSQKHNRPTVHVETILRNVREVLVL